MALIIRSYDSRLGITTVLRRFGPPQKRYLHRIKWLVPANFNGFILQKIIRSTKNLQQPHRFYNFTTVRRPGAKYRPQYWEIWEVINGDVYPAIRPQGGHFGGLRCVLTNAQCYDYGAGFNVGFNLNFGAGAAGTLLNRIVGTAHVGSPHAENDYTYHDEYTESNDANLPNGYVKIHGRVFLLMHTDLVINWLKNTLHIGQLSQREEQGLGGCTPGMLPASVKKLDRDLAENLSLERFESVQWTTAGGNTTVSPRAWPTSSRIGRGLPQGTRDEDKDWQAGSPAPTVNIASE